MFGNNKKIKVIDFLLENRFWDYPIKDIAKQIGMSKKHLSRILPAFLELNVMKETRKIGLATLYQANMDSPLMKKAEELSLEIATIINDKITEN